MSADDARQQQAMEANNSEAAPSLYDELARQPAAPPATDARPAAPAPQAKFTTLQKHIAFFDRDGDGVVGVTDTFRGFRALGFPIWFSVLAVLVINLNFACALNDAWEFHDVDGTD